MASVDVVVPCYKYARYLRACVQSILSQENVDVRVLIIDDHSPDDTPEVGGALAREDSRVTYVRNEVNLGHIATYNKALARATADYVVLLSADDLLTPGALGRAAALMDANPSVGLVYGNPISLYGDEVPRARTQSTGNTVWKGPDWIRLMCQAGRNFINCPEAVMRTSVLHRLGGYKAALPHSADMEMWLRAAAISDVGRVNGADQAYYRVHSQSMQRTIFAGVMPDLIGRRDAYISALTGGDVVVDDANALLDTARRAVALDAVKWAVRTVKSKTPDLALIEQYRQFALSTSPGIEQTPEWNALARRTVAGPGLRATLVRILSAKIEHFQHQRSWRKWWRTGVY